MTNSEHLQWLHDRIVNVYGESENVDFLIKFREIIKDIKDEEDIKYIKENIMKRIKRKLRAIIDIIKSDKFFLATFKEDNELDWWTEFNIERNEYIDQL